MRSIPEWMRAPVLPAPVAAPRVAPLRRSLARLMSAVTAPASTGGWLGARDARAKLLAFTALALTATLSPSLPAIIWCYGVALALAISSGVSLRRLAAFSWWPLVLASAVALPACLNVITPGRTLYVFASLPEGRHGPWTLPAELAVTDQGLVVAARLIARMAACAMSFLVLVATTRPDRLWRGLRGLGAPKLFVVLLATMHRYLDVLMRAAVDLHLARISRTIARVNLRRERRWIAVGIGSLYRRSRALASAVHLAMWSRGFTGEIHLLRQPHWTGGDTVLVTALVLVCFVLLRMP